MQLVQRVEQQGSVVPFHPGRNGRDGRGSAGGEEDADLAGRIGHLRPLHDARHPVAASPHGQFLHAGTARPVVRGSVGPRPGRCEFSVFGHHVNRHARHRLAELVEHGGGQDNVLLPAVRHVHDGRLEVDNFRETGDAVAPEIRGHAGEHLEGTGAKDGARREAEPVVGQGVLGIRHELVAFIRVLVDPVRCGDHVPHRRLQGARFQWRRA